MMTDKDGGDGDSCRQNKKLISSSRELVSAPAATRPASSLVFGKPTRDDGTWNGPHLLDLWPLNEALALRTS